MDKTEIIEFLKENLSLDIDYKSVYTGGNCGDDLYRDIMSVQLILCNEIISEIDVN